MSSATSIKEMVGGGLKTPAPQAKTSAPSDAADIGFRPWHFFVLASLIAATAAVVVSRQFTPEHLVLISLTIVAAGIAAAGFYRMLAPLATEDTSLFSEPLSDRMRAALEREKGLTLRSIKELEFDRAMGKLSERDFQEMAGRLRARAISLIKQLDEGSTGYRALIERELAARLGQRGAWSARVAATASTAVQESRAASPSREPRVPSPESRVPSREPRAASPSPHACSACGTTNDADAAFCKRCGRKLGHEPATNPADGR
jgi:hypothetical protein